MKTHSLPAALAVVLLAALATPATAWEFFISPPTYPEGPIKWYELDSDPATARVTVLVDDGGLGDITGSDPDQGVTATVGALHAWNSPALDRLVTALPAASPVFNIVDGQPTLHFSDPTGDCTGACLALTIVTYDDEGEIRRCNGTDYLPYYDTDIVINAPAWNWTSEAEDPALSGCFQEFYIEAVISHEAGHLLGLGHEDDVHPTQALMYPSLDYCDNKALQQDDLAGRDVIYDCDGNCTTLLPPSAAFSASSTGLVASFTDQSSDSDGSIVTWSWSFGDGNTSSAQNPGHTYAASGTYTVTLTVTDNDGLTDNSNQNLTVSDGSGISLSASGYKVKGVQHVDLSWSGGGSNVDIFRDNVPLLLNTGNTGAYTDNIGVKGGGYTYLYRVCDAGSTSNCSNTVSVTF